MEYQMKQFLKTEEEVGFHPTSLYYGTPRCKTLLMSAIYMIQESFR